MTQCLAGSDLLGHEDVFGKLGDLYITVEAAGSHVQYPRGVLPLVTVNAEQDI